MRKTEKLRSLLDFYLFSTAMLMRRFNYGGHLVCSILEISIGLYLPYQAVNGQLDWWRAVLGFCFLLPTGIDQFLKALQTIEVSENRIVHYGKFKKTCVAWEDINAYFLDGQRFVALDIEQHKILLDIDITPADKMEWPTKEQKQVVEFIKRKMHEVGASQESTLSLRHNHGIEIKP